MDVGDNSANPVHLGKRSSNSDTNESIDSTNFAGMYKIYDIICAYGKQKHPWC